MTFIDCPYCGKKMESMKHECPEGKIAQLEAKLEQAELDHSAQERVKELEAEVKRLRECLRQRLEGSPESHKNEGYTIFKNKDIRAALEAGGE